MFLQVEKLHAVGLDKQRLVELLEKEELGALVLTSPESVYYFTGYTALPTSGNPILYSLRNVFPYSVVVERNGDRHLICWGFSVQDVEPDAEQVVSFNDRLEAFKKLEDVLMDALQSSTSKGSRRIGIEASCPYSVARLMDGLGGVETVPVDSLLLSLKRRKSPAEVELLRKSVEIAEAAVERVFAELRVGSSRLAMMALAKQEVLRLGGDAVGHVTMSFGHANPEIAIDETLQPGDLVVVDVGAKYRDYTSDCRRYGYVGEVPEAVAERHRQMCEVVAEIGAALQPAATFSSLMALGQNGFATRAVPLLGRFTHVGHGIGLETEEEWIDDDSSRSIEAGMVVAIEVYAEVDGHGAIGDEETYVVWPDGPEQLTKLPLGIREI